MRILSLSCTNLNSLRGKQDTIYFDRGPLAAAGLFSITGPTGTGKTTLLDAITLALYGKVYRFEDDGAALKSEEVLNQLMTIGTGRCEVEVTFRAEGAVYHAKWACQRAHKKTEGAVQKAEMWLSQFDADGKLGSPYKTRSEVAKEVARLTQLDFGQFVRSVLLPQGAFAQFLKAKKGGRAELLQKLTDTRRFADIGYAAHQRTQMADKALATAAERATLYAGQLLSPEKQTMLAEETAAAAARLTTLNREMAELETARQWFDEDRKAQKALADHDQESIDSAAAAAAPAAVALREMLARHQQAEPCREAWEDWTRATKEAEKLTGDHRHLDGTRATYAEATLQAQKVVNTTEADWKKAREANQHQAPQLRRASQLDEQYTAALEEVENQQARVEEAEKKHTGRQEHLETEQDKLATARSDYQTAHDWLTAHPTAATLTADALRSPADAWRQYEKAQTQQANLDKRAADDADTAGKLARQLEENAEQQAKNQQQQTGHAEEQKRELAAFGTFIGQLIGHGRWLAAALEASQSTLLQLESHHRRLDALNKLPAYRATLTAGEPCPLCGARHHDVPAVLTASDAEVTAAAEAVTTHQALLTALQNRVAAGREAFVSAKAVWPADVPPPPTAEAIAHFTETEEAAWPIRTTSFKKAQATADRRQQQTANDLAKLAAAAATLRGQQAALALAATARQPEHDASIAQQQREQATLTAFFATLGRPFAPLTAAADLDELRALGETYRIHHTARATARSTGEEAKKQVVLQEEAVAAAALALLKEQQLLRDRTAAAAALRTERLTLCGADQDPASVLAALEKAEAAAFGALEKARLALANAEKVQLEHQTRLTEALTNLQQTTTRRDDCHAHWQAQRDAHQIPPDTDLATWLIRDAAHLQDRRTELAALDECCRSTAKLREATYTRWRQHRQAGPCYASAAAVQALINELTAERDDLLKATGTRDGQLTQHAEAAAASLAEVDALEQQQRETARWQDLNKLIGGSEKDTPRFSRFAQSLTLAHLVGEANRHLLRLAPRYELLPKTDDDELGLWVLDADHAGTARAVESLSGGETFLVSLALALGLSDLAGYRVQIESLFIDEGFGTLDPETLDTAISALEVVQQSGRMVGVISHVVALKERIKTQIQLRRVAGGSRLAVVVVP